MEKQTKEQKITECLKMIEEMKIENEKHYNQGRNQAISEFKEKLKEDVSNGCGNEFLSEDGDWELMCGRNKQLCEHCQAQLEFINKTAQEITK